MSEIDLMEWTETNGSTPFISALDMIYARGRYGDIYGPVPFGLIHPASWHGDMMNASLDLVAFSLVRSTPDTGRGG